MLIPHHFFYGVITSIAMVYMLQASGMPYFKSSAWIIISGIIGCVFPDFIMKKPFKDPNKTYFEHDPALIVPIAFLLTGNYPFLFNFFFQYLAHLFLDFLTWDGITFFRLFRKKPFYAPWAIRANPYWTKAKVYAAIFTALTVLGIWYMGKNNIIFEIPAITLYKIDELTGIPSRFGYMPY